MFYKKYQNYALQKYTIIFFFCLKFQKKIFVSKLIRGCLEMIVRENFQIILAN